MGFSRIFLVIFLFALLEAMVLAKVAQIVGWGFTILATVFTAMLGSMLFRWQGLETWVRLNQRLQQGQMPGTELVEGVLLLLGGALLITPGFITDAIGFLLLIPLSRKALAGFMVRRGMLQTLGSRPGGNAHVWVYTRGYGTGPTPQQEDPSRPRVRESDDGHLIIDGEAERKED